MNDEIDNLNVSVAAIAYYLYRQALCPCGDTLTGFTMWLDMQKDVFEKLADPEGEDDDPT
jgi:hypothetical protein